MLREQWRSGAEAAASGDSVAEPSVGHVVPVGHANTNNEVEGAPQAGDAVRAAKHTCTANADVCAAKLKFDMQANMVVRTV